jgi:LuxR family maltose regulon positive regulatory protein
VALAGATGAGVDADASALRRLARLRGAELDVDAGCFDAAVTALCSIAEAGDDEWMCAEASAVVALVDAANGNLPAAERRAAAVLAEGDAHDLHPTALVAAHLAEALCCAQRSERRNALAHLDHAEAPGSALPRPLHATRRAVRAALGHSARSAAWLDSVTAEQPLATQALVACGTLEIVDPESRLVPVGGPAERAVARARQELARGAPDAARTALARALGTRPGGGVTDRAVPRSLHPRTAIEARVLAAVAAARARDGNDAARHLGVALDLVAWSDVRAPLLDHGGDAAGVDDLLGLLGGPGVEGQHRGLALALVDQLRRATSGTGAPVDELTERETAVLQYLPTLMSNAEIAQGLHLSINTVKSHLKAVYRKLGVVGRRDAVLRGRELELI